MAQKMNPNPLELISSPSSSPNKLNKHTMAQKMNPNPLELISSPPTVIRQIQGPMPPPLRVSKDSHNIKKPIRRRRQRSIYQTSGSNFKSMVQLYQTSGSNFKSMVQLYQTSFSPNQQSLPDVGFVEILRQASTHPGSPEPSTLPPIPDGFFSPAARLASIVKASPSKRDRDRADSNNTTTVMLEEEVVEILSNASTHPGVLSPSPSTLLPIKDGVFSPVIEPQSYLVKHELSPLWHNAFMASTSGLFSAPLISPSPSCTDLFNLFYAVLNAKTEISEELIKNGGDLAEQQPRRSLFPEMPESSYLPLRSERKGGMEAEPAKETDLTELTVEEGMDSESQACKEQELGNAAYTKNDFDTAIAHYTKVVELDDGHISCLMNRAVAYLAMGQYEECINDYDKAVEKGIQLKSDSKMIAIALTRKGTVLVKMAKLSKDYELAIKSFQKALSEHHNPDTLKKLDDAKKAKRELEQQEYFDTKLADEEHEKEEKSEKQIVSEPHGMVFDVEEVKMNDSGEQNKSEIEEIGNAASHSRQPEVIQVEEMQPQALSALKPQGVVFDVEAVKILKPSEQMEFQIEDDDMEPEASEQHQLFITQGSEKSEKHIVSEAHGMAFDVEAVKMTDSGEQNKPEIEEIGNVALYKIQPEVIQVEEMQPQALSTLKPQGVVFDDEAVKILKPNGQMEFQNEDNDMEPEASEQHGLFIKQGGLVFTKPTKDEDWKHAKEIYLMDNELSVLPENPRCLNLSALFLPRNYKLRVIPPSFFNYMPTLQILNLSRTGIKSLPDSLFQLVSLKRLFLNDCHRLMILSPKVGDLEKLEVLDLEGAKIMNLPKEIKKLTNLTCLEVSFYGYMGNGRRPMQSNAVVPCGVICSLPQLEELNIDVNPDDERWDTCVEDIVNEVCNFKRLETFKFYFPRVELLRHFQWNSLSLSHFRFTVGHHVKRIMSRVPLDVEFELERWERCLKYINGVGVPRDIKNVLQHATAFFLDRHATVKKLSDFGTRNMKQIKCCVVGECNEVQMIIDTADAYGEDGISEIVSESHDAERIVLGSLEYLYIYYMKSLRSIWEGPVPQNSLFLLKSLTLRTCPQLTTIFTQELLDNLCSLEELKVEDCPSIKSIVSCKIPAENRTSYFLPNLKKISLHYMLGLVSISSGLQIAPKLEWLSFYNCPSLSNPLVNEVSSHDLKKIKGERIWWEALEWSNGRPDYLDEIFVPIDLWEC